MRGGLGPVAAIAAFIGGMLVWTMAAHDPYWRLFETPSLPAPDYESPEEIEAAIATAAVVARNPDSGAIRPDAAAPAKEPVTASIALAPRPAEPLIAVPATLSDEPPAGSPEPARNIDDEPAGAAPVLAEAPPALVQADRAAADVPPVEDSSAPAPVTVAEAPSPLWVAADESSEAVLTLSRAERKDVQRRLALAGFDPRGFDGVFGPRTREAIADFQAAWGFPATGYLDTAVHAELAARTEEAYAALASQAASEPRGAPELAPVARERQVAANGTAGCARDADGRIVERQSLGCDLKGLAEKVVSLGRSKLPHEESVAIAGGPDSAVTYGGDR